MRTGSAVRSEVSPNIRRIIFVSCFHRLLKNRERCVYSLFLPFFTASVKGQSLQGFDSLIKVRLLENAAIDCIIIRIKRALSDRTHQRTVPVVDQDPLNAV